MLTCTTRRHCAARHYQPLRPPLPRLWPVYLAFVACSYAVALLIAGLAMVVDWILRFAPKAFIGLLARHLRRR